ncbi:MAG TPA: CHASE2 domain-containing protein [Rheinheimera sp.]|uniref:CHASE2 domain-containing protein n=1 Tax=Rheinheimera sp. TaxID=1869214 RepID=UPI002F949291
MSLQDAKEQSPSGLFKLALNSFKLLFLMFILALDPFGLTSASDTASANVVNKVLSLYYPATAQQEITVVLIDDIALDAIQAHWPLSYQEQAKLYRTILNYQPRALFSDLLYTFDRSTASDKVEFLNNTFERYRHIPIYLPKPMRPTTEQRPEFRHTKPVFVQWSGAEHYYPRIFNELRSPAQALYELHCSSNSCPSEPEVQTPPHIAVQWGSRLAPVQQNITDTSHCQPESHSFFAILDMLFDDIFWKTNTEWRQPCPYHITINAAQLRANDTSAKQLFTELIQDKYVFLGAYIQGAKDSILSPVHGNVPGVYLHAMAFDNLLTYGERHYRPSHEIFGNVDINDLVDSLFFICFMLLRDAPVSPSENTNTKSRIRWYHTWRLAALLAVAMLLTSLFFAVVLHYEPINWLGLSVLFLAISYHKFISNKVNYLIFSKIPKIFSNKNNSVRSNANENHHSD